MADRSWEQHELPLLEQVLEVEQLEPPHVLQLVSQGRATAPAEDVRALERLIDAGYVEGNSTRAHGGTMFHLVATRLTEKGLRAVGAWPTPNDGGEVLLEVLQQLIDQAPSDEERTRLQKLQSAAGDVGKASLTALVVGAVKGLGGLP